MSWVALAHAPPSEVDRTLLAAVAQISAGNAESAADLLRNALAQAPDHPMVLTKLAELEIARKNHAGAVSHLNAVLRQEPNFAPALTLLAEASWIAGRPQEGLAHARRAVEIQPHNAINRLMLAQLCVWLGHHDEAERIIQPLIEDEFLEAATRSGACNALAELFVARGDYAGAIAPLRRALELAPDLAATHMRLGMDLLRLGEFDEGWREYEYREQVPFFHPHGPLILPGRPWNGEELRDRFILIVDDQGNGDAIQTFRYLKLIRQLAPTRIVLRTFAALQRIFAEAAPFAEVVTELPAGITPDIHCLSSSLPFRCSTRLDTIPRDVPYLRALSLGPSDSLRLPDGEGQKIGLVWSGDRRHLRDHLRSIPAARFLRLADIAGPRFFSLQHEPRQPDILALKVRPNIERVGERVRDYAETAAVIAQLDLVISVDTSVAHLAGALGKPVWILLPMASDWRWLTNRDDTPWYPTARLFRAGSDGWPAVLRRVARELRLFAGNS